MIHDKDKMELEKMRSSSAEFVPYLPFSFPSPAAVAKTNTKRDCRCTRLNPSYVPRLPFPTSTVSGNKKRFVLPAAADSRLSRVFESLFLTPATAIPQSTTTKRMASRMNRWGCRQNSSTDYVALSVIGRISECNPSKRRGKRFPSCLHLESF